MKFKNLVLLIIAIALASAVLGQTNISNAPSQPSTLNSPNVLDAYAELTGRTVLHVFNYPALPRELLSKLPSDPNDAVMFLEVELARAGVEVVRKGEKLVILMPSASRAAWGKWISTIARPASDGPVTVKKNGINFTNANLNQLIPLYAQFSTRTVLRPSSLSTIPLALKNQTDLTTNELIYAFKAMLALNGIEVADDGKKFARLQRFEGRNPTLENQLAAIPKPSSNGRSMVSVGGISFSSATLNQALQIYGAFSGRTVLESARVVSGSIIVLQNQTALTQDELLYAIKTVVTLNGVAMVDDGEKFVQVVPLDQVGRIETRAPKTDTNATAIAKDRIAVFDYPNSAIPKLPPPPTNIVGQVTDKAVALYDKLFPKYQQPRFAPNLGPLLDYYARVTQQKLLVSNISTNQPVSFEAEGPLTIPELIYALETTLKLNDVAVVPLGDKSARVMPLAWIGQVNPTNLVRLLTPPPVRGTNQ